MTMVAWRSHHKHLSTEVVGTKAVGCYTHRHTMNIGLSAKSLKTIMIEPAVDDHSKFILLLTKRHTAN